MTAVQADMLRSKYRPNRKYEPRIYPSTLVLTLRELPWVPQGNGQFVPPSKASRDLLPKGFTFDPRWAWLKEIGFGEESASRDEDCRRTRERYRELGFGSDEEYEDGKWFASLDTDTRRRYRAEREAVTNPPQQQPGNPARRAERVREEARTAPGRETSVRNRSVSEYREAVRRDARVYLRGQYTNSDEVMICQVCETALPFRLDDGSYYFEAVEFLPTLEGRHYQNYLALCPNHAAMFMYANGSKELKDMFLEMEGSELEVVLANENHTIYFTETHMIDLKAVIESESSDQQGS